MFNEKYHSDKLIQSISYKYIISSINNCDHDLKFSVALIEHKPLMFPIKLIDEKRRNQK